MKKSFNIQELLHFKSKHHGTKPTHPSSSRAFQRHQEHDLKHPSLVDLITTKQNKTKQTTLHPSSLRAFQRHQEHDLKHPSLMDLITTKQTTLLHR